MYLKYVRTLFLEYSDFFMAANIIFIVNYYGGVTSTVHTHGHMNTPSLSQSKELNNGPTS